MKANFQLLNIDCLDNKEGIPSLPDNSVDIAIVDPPYGIDYQSARRIDKSKWHKKIANDKQPFTAWIAPLFPKMKDGGRLFIFYRWDVMDVFLTEARNAGFKPVWDLVWDKVLHGMGDLKATPAARHEPFMYFTKGRYEFKGKRPVTVYKTPRVFADKMIHPNEKPVKLYEALIRDFASKGEFMLDPFLGSAASCDAAMKLGLQYKGFEIDKDYFNAASERMSFGVQGNLF